LAYLIIYKVIWHVQPCDKWDWSWGHICYKHLVQKWSEESHKNNFISCISETKRKQKHF